MWEDIEAGAEFYFSEEDYLSPEELNGTPVKSFFHKRHKRPRYRIKLVQEYSVKKEENVKREGSVKKERSPSLAALPFESQEMAGEPSTARLRPRRSNINKSYAVPDSDDDAIADDQDEMVQHVSAHAKKRKAESNMHKWIKHLTALMKEEEKKVRECSIPLIKKLIL